MHLFSDWDIWVVALEEVLARYEKVVYLGHVLKKYEGHWLLVLRAKRPKGAKLVAFYHASTPIRCFQAMALEVTHKKGIAWHTDLY